MVRAMFDCVTRGSVAPGVHRASGRPFREEQPAVAMGWRGTNRPPVLRPGAVVRCATARVVDERRVGVGEASVVVLDAQPAVSTTIVATRTVPRTMNYV